ncbi:hypothetical protein [Streptomyces aidingensis]|uniref:Uncharacterized protein n=1 Tax=Streptomyces aidingensis TaxID=910347 RepID=A0A1I1PWW7_9ACTN|nr:hypothetical protein [Streptomyces aidingensis]SFD14386.1 hypothetical protein SAMN05421773_110113 [Streptomyces aidingensis]
MSTAIPAGLMPQTLTQVRPVEITDGYGSQEWDYGPDATRTEITGWLQQDQRQAVTGGITEGRDPQREKWLLITNHTDVRALDRYEWSGPAGAVVFETDGPPAPVFTPRGFHHSEVALRILTG